MKRAALRVRAFVIIACSPLAAWSLEPADPVGYCSRFLDEKSIEQCQKQATQENVDWYAAALCNLQQEDTAFWKCWQTIRDQAFNPKAIIECATRTEASDEERQSCVEGLTKKNSSARQPASLKGPGIFQDLPKIKKPKSL